MNSLGQNLTGVLESLSGEGENLKKPRSGNMTPEQEREILDFEWKLGVIVPTIYAFVVVIGLFGNSLVILVVAINKQMRNSTNMLVVNLAVADFVFLTLCVPFSAVFRAYRLWVFAKWWCTALGYLQYVSAYSSVWTLTLLALDRYLAVCIPIRSRRYRTERNTVLVLLLTWLLIFLANLPILSVYGVWDYVMIGERSYCGYVDMAKGAAKKINVIAYHMSFVFFGYLLPLSLTSILYMALLVRLWNMSRPGGMEGSRMAERRMATKRKITRMSAGVILTFAICWLPINICFSISALLYHTHISLGKPFVVASVCAQVLAYSNACLNPILYAFLSENFRNGFLKIIRGGLAFVFRCKLDCYAQSKLSTADDPNRTALTTLNESARNGAGKSLISGRHNENSVAQRKKQSPADELIPNPEMEMNNSLIIPRPKNSHLELTHIEDSEYDVSEDDEVKSAKV